jgi:hypothetical protein
MLAPNLYISLLAIAGWLTAAPNIPAPHKGPPAAFCHFTGAIVVEMSHAAAQHFLTHLSIIVMRRTLSQTRQIAFSFTFYISMWDTLFVFLTRSNLNSFEKEPRREAIIVRFVSMSKCQNRLWCRYRRIFLVFVLSVLIDDLESFALEII